jgi:Protein of unknown function (DUF3644)/EC042_2821-lke REase
MAPTSKTPKLKQETALVSNARSAMFAAVEIHNKPIFEYRYEVCTLLVVNAWELALKAYIAKELTSVRLIKKDGTTKPFPECIACVSSKIGKSFEPVRLNLEILYEYRNKVAHFYPDDLGIVVLGLLKASVLFFSDFMEKQFGEKLYEAANLILLPIGFTKPMSPLDFLSNQSAAKECSAEVKAFLESIKRSSESLQKQGVEDSIIVNYSIGLVNESRIKNADLTAAINNALPQGNAIAVYNVISAANLTSDPTAKLIRLSEESIFNDIFTESYYDVVRLARERFTDFVQNTHFNEIMREVKKNLNIARTRLLNPRNPKGGQQIFYSKMVVEELAKHYKPRKEA